MDDPDKTPRQPKKWLQLVLLIVELLLFIVAWALLIFGIFHGFFAILLILISGVVIFLSIRGHSDED